MSEIIKQEEKKIIFSGIQPSGTITLGNYLGALKHWVELQNDYNCIFSLVDLHAITVRQDPAKFRHNTLEAYALLLAMGIDPEKSTFFLQSHVHTHAELCWVLDCYTQFGELSRMTQFKDKSVKHADNINAGLFTYPSLMVADILLYQADLVPVGADQKQHLELTRTIAQRFNQAYSPTFTIPEPYIPKVGAKIMSLQDPTRKMSKSDENVNGYIAVLDKPEDIVRKFKRAITDSEGKVYVGDGKDGINNLISIMSSVTDMTPEQITVQYEGKGYGDFKAEVADAVVAHLEPIQTKYKDLVNNKDYLQQCYRDGAQKAIKASQKTLGKVMKKVGFIQP